MNRWKLPAHLLSCPEHQVRQSPMLWDACPERIARENGTCIEKLKAMILWRWSSLCRQGRPCMIYADRFAEASCVLSCLLWFLPTVISNQITGKNAGSGKYQWGITSGKYIGLARTIYIRFWPTLEIHKERRRKSLGLLVPLTLQTKSLDAKQIPKESWLQ